MSSTAAAVTAVVLSEDLDSAARDIDGLDLIRFRPLECMTHDRKKQG